MSLDEVDSTLKDRITGAFRDVHQTATENGASTRTEAMIVEEVTDAIKTLGVFT